MLVLCVGATVSHLAAYESSGTHTQILGHLHQAQNAEIGRLKQEVQEGVVQQLILEAHLA